MSPHCTRAALIGPTTPRADAIVDVQGKNIPPYEYCRLCGHWDFSTGRASKICAACDDGTLQSSSVEGDVRFVAAPHGFHVGLQSAIIERLRVVAFLATMIVVLAGAVVLMARTRPTPTTPMMSANAQLLSQVSDDYLDIVTEIGSIASSVFYPEAQDFEGRRALAYERIATLEERIQVTERRLSVIASKSEDERVAIEHFSNAFEFIGTREINELKEFVAVVDVSLVRAMMAGEISRSPFERAATVGKETAHESETAFSLLGGPER